MGIREYEWVVSSWVAEKLKSRDIDLVEVEEAVQNSTQPYIVDTRPDHATVPPTYWFIAPTMSDRLLKVVFVLDRSKKVARIKTAYEPSDEEIDFYEQY